MLAEDVEPESAQVGEPGVAAEPIRPSMFEPSDVFRSVVTLLIVRAAVPPLSNGAT